VILVTSEKDDRLSASDYLLTYCEGRDASNPDLILTERKYAGSCEALQLGLLASGTFQLGVVQLGYIWAVGTSLAE